MKTNVLGYLYDNSAQILADLAKNFKPTGIFKTAASLVASRVLILILAWIYRKSLENVKVINN